MSVRALLGLCLGSLLLGSAPARAEPSPYLGRDNPLAALLPSAQALSARERERSEQAIARALRALPDVQQVEVLIRQPEAGATPLDVKPEPLDVLVRVEERGRGVSELEIERRVRAQLPTLEREHVRVVRTAVPAAAPPPSFAHVGPFLVAHESSSPLRATLVACLSANALLATLLLVRRRAR